jgi:lipopolysaccharide/colanic/teichoic acid biosynthesis glycosyltransferase
MWKSWDKLPENMKTDAVLPYYEALRRHRAGLIVKRIADILLSSVLIVVLSPVLLVIAVMIKIDSPGPVFYRQVRVTRYNKDFRIFKFRTMIVNADEKGALVTTSNDSRITRVGSKLRKYRLDEFPQLFNVFKGEMSLVGTRPEVRKYVDEYTDEMMATLLLPAGVTSEASIAFKDEDKILAKAEDVDKAYIEEVLPEKMKYNLNGVRYFSLRREFRLLFKTVIAVAR